MKHSKLLTKKIIADVEHGVQFKSARTVTEDKDSCLDLQEIWQSYTKDHQPTKDIQILE